MASPTKKSLMRSSAAVVKDQPKSSLAAEKWSWSNKDGWSVKAVAANWW